jgi:hypothetical protein
MHGVVIGDFLVKKCSGGSVVDHQIVRVEKISHRMSPVSPKKIAKDMLNLLGAIFSMPS